MIPFAFALLAASVTDPSVTLQDCRLITANGEDVAFHLEARAGLQVKVEPLGATAWPSKAIPFSGNTASKSDHLVLQAPDGMVFIKLDSAGKHPTWRTVTVFSRNGDEDGLPLAYGFCGAAANNSVANVFGQQSAAGGSAPRYPAAWSDRCSILAQDGRRSTIRLSGNKTSIIEPLDHAIWPDTKITIPRISPPGHANGRIFVEFAISHDSKPNDGIVMGERVFIDQQTKIAVWVLDFLGMGSGSPSHDGMAIGMCGSGRWMDSK